MKKTLSIILCLFLVFSLAACGGNNENSGGENPSVDVGANNSSSNNTGGDFDGSSISGEALYANVLKALGNPKVTKVVGSEADPSTHMFRIDENGVQVRYIGIKAQKPGETVNIMQATDFHFNKMSDRDNAEQNPAIMDTRKYRKGFRDESTVPNAKRVIEIGKKFDAVALTGDNIDYLTWGSLDLIKEHIWDVLGDKVIMPLGGHDATRVMESYVKDNTTLESRFDILQSGWQHDVHYSNKIVKDRVMLVQLNNGQSKYYGTQAEKLAADIKYARENNLVILIFQHEPVATGDTAQARVVPITGGNNYENFYKNYIGGSKSNSDDVTKKVYNLITNNADVVRGVFAGHLHQNYYTEIKATYEKDGAKVNAVIPQIVLQTATSAEGYITVINIE